RPPRDARLDCAGAVEGAGVRLAPLVRGMITMMRTLVASAAGFGLLAAGCSSGARPVMPDVLPQAAAQEAVQPSYRVGPFDLLQVNVFGVPELSGAAQVDGDGRLTLPLIGGMDAMG